MSTNIFPFHAGRSLVLLVAALLSFSPAAAFAQQGGLMVNEEMQRFLNNRNQVSPNALLDAQNEIFPTDIVISPEHYYVGPGDLLIVQIVGASSGEFPVIVSPENSINIPRIGEVSLKGLTLAEAKATVEEKVMERNPHWQVYLSLQQARLVFVTISGNVSNPRMYTLPASLRVSTAVRIASQPQVLNTLQEYSFSRLYRPADEIGRENIASDADGQFVGDYTSRNIRVHHADGSSQVSDLLKANLLADPTADPLLREGDHIFVPFDNDAAPLISISGAVYRPSVIAYKPGDKISFLLKAGYGLTDLADSAAVFLINPAAGERVRLDLAAVLDGSGDREIAPGSSIVVEEKTVPDVLRNTVAVIGAVRLPGTFLIESDQTRLRDIIERAGGFTDQAYLPLAYIQRLDVLGFDAANRQVEMMRSYQYSNLELGDTARFNMHLLLRRPFVSCDFVAAFEENSETDNVVLQDGDIIFVPTDPQNVFVDGHVVKPGYVKYVPGKTLAWYVARAGGPADGGEVERASVIKGRTRVWVEGEELVINSGDLIYVPRSPEYPPGIEEQRYGLYVSIASSAIFLISTIINFFR